jgi:putative stress-induced transcription regulator
MARSREREFALMSNHRCLDFVNTELMQRGQSVDLLTDPRFGGLVTAPPVLGPAEAEGALRRWSDTPAGARALVEARTLRAHFRVMLEQLERGRPIAASTLEAINSLLARPIGPGFLRPQQEPRSPLVQYERLRQSDEGRRVPSARQRRPG